MSRILSRNHQPYRARFQYLQDTRVLSHSVGLLYSYIRQGQFSGNEGQTNNKVAACQLLDHGNTVLSNISVGLIYQIGLNHED